MNLKVRIRDDGLVSLIKKITANWLYRNCIFFFEHAGIALKSDIPMEPKKFLAFTDNRLLLATAQFECEQEIKPLELYELKQTDKTSFEIEPTGKKAREYQRLLKFSKPITGKLHTNNYGSLRTDAIAYALFKHTQKAIQFKYIAQIARFLEKEYVLYFTTNSDPKSIVLIEAFDVNNKLKKFAMVSPFILEGGD